MTKFDLLQKGMQLGIGGCVRGHEQLSCITLLVLFRGSVNTKREISLLPVYRVCSNAALFCVIVV
jgi:hypothetical protein